jgi:hypothetical protein
MAKVARGLGLTRATVAIWDKVPADRVAEVAQITGIPAAELRPDLAAAFASATP